jgi:hypothetical protein
VHRPLGEQRENGVADVGPTARSAATASVTATTHAGTAETGTPTSTEGEAGRESEATLAGLVNVLMKASHDLLRSVADT